MKTLFTETHLHRLIGGDEGKHEVEPWTAGGGQQSSAPVTIKQTASHHLVADFTSLQNTATERNPGQVAQWS